MKVIAFLIALTALAEAITIRRIEQVKSRKRRILFGCAEIETSCSVKPCCHHYNVEKFYVEPLHCFQFGEKVCKTYRSIPNRGEYFRLLDESNGTNHREMCQKYWLSLQPSTTQLPTTPLRTTLKPTTPLRTKLKPTTPKELIHTFLRFR